MQALRHPTLRRRLAVAAALAVALTVAVASVSAYLAVQSRLRADIDNSLRERAAAAAAGGPARGRQPAFSRPDRFLDLVREVPGAAVYIQLVDVDGDTLQAPGSPRLPVDETVLAVAAGSAGTRITDERVAGADARVIAAPVAPGVAVQIARPTAEADALLDDLRAVLVVVTILGAVLAALLGWAISGRALRPVRQFTSSTEDIAAAADISRRLQETGDDELGRLARSFNTTLDALEGSVEAQRRLVSDASHELRTPLASLRTNIEVLQRGVDMPDAQRREILADLVEQADELGKIVGDLVDMARRADVADTQETRLDDITRRMVERARRVAPRLAIAADLEPWVVSGSPERLGRLVANLLDNAAKWSPPGGEVEVRLRAGELTVRDHGPGFDAADLPHVFDRFYRAAAARGMPGSGLGLSIVRQVAEAHGGTAVAENHPDGGALLRVRIPGERPGGDGARGGAPAG
jgi:two-component system sensor histidine kinase MprB